MLLPIEAVSTLSAPNSDVSRHCALSITLDGTRWRVLFGADEDTGVAGFGVSPTKAIINFESKFQVRYSPSKHPDTPWSAALLGDDQQESGLVVYRSTKAEAIRTLLAMIEERGQQLALHFSR